jgi:hypothetical protein
MKLPEFTAQASLYRTSNCYRSPGQRGESQRTVVMPQLGGPGFGGLQNCINDCVDQLLYYHPELKQVDALKQCRASCRDPGGIGGSGGGRKRDPAIDVLCAAQYAGCWATEQGSLLELLCEMSWLTGYDGPCSCAELRDRCLSD